MTHPLYKPPDEIVPAWIRDIPMEKFPETYQEIAKMIGRENTLKLAAAFGGSSVYLPTLERCLREVRNKTIWEEFDGANARELARRWGMSHGYVRHIIKIHRSKPASQK